MATSYDSAFAEDISKPGVEYRADDGFEFIRLRDMSYEHGNPITVPGLSLATIIGPSWGRQRVRNGDGNRHVDVTPKGSLMDFTDDLETISLDGQIECVWTFVSEPKLEELTGDTFEALWRRIGTLRFQIVENDVVLDGLNTALWRTAGMGDRQASLYLEQGFLTILGHMEMLAAGRDVGRSGPHPNDSRLFDGPSAALQGKESRRLRRVIELIDASLGDDLRIATIAAEAGMSPSTLSRLFKAATGRSVWRYVLDRRLERAAEMLRRTDEPVAGIAHACGFSSQAHLTKAFRDGYGMPPARFREEVGTGSAVAVGGR
ncbi:MAG: AraC family transcriptional regulator [Pseudomonadota bacterium]